MGFFDSGNGASLPGDFYSLVAPFYDALVGPFLRPARKEICRIARDGGCRRVLDVACGTGEQVAMLADAGLDASGIDLSPAMLRQASIRQTPGAAFFLGDATRMPFSTGSFDCATISLALHEMEPEIRPRVVGEMLRVLAPGGRLIVLDYAHPNGYASGLGLGFLGLVERMAGKRHFTNFVRFARSGAIEEFLEGYPVRIVSGRKYFLGGIGLYTALKPADGPGPD